MKREELETAVITLLGDYERRYDDIVRALPEVPVMQLQGLLAFLLRHRRIDKVGAYYRLPPGMHKPVPYLDLIEIR